MADIKDILENLRGLKDSVDRIENETDDAYNNAAEAAEYANYAQSSAGDATSTASDASSEVTFIIEHLETYLEEQDNSAIPEGVTAILELLRAKIKVAHDLVGDIDRLLNAAISDLNNTPLPLKEEQPEAV
jgi:uncharacterized phage infection (PIP) family protein YhgE